MSIRDALNSELGREVKRLREENEEVHAAAVQMRERAYGNADGYGYRRVPGLWDREKYLSYWSVRRDGYQAFCLKCGFPMMLCGECLVDSDDFCDWDGSTILCHRMIERLWKDLEMLCLTRIQMDV